jgi:general secretion pathway protein J
VSNQVRIPLFKATSQSGFTLVEVLIVMLIMSIMAALSWQGVSTLANTLTITQDHELSLSSIESSFSQWQSDLDATLPRMPAPNVSSINWDGKVLRLVRKAPRVSGSPQDMGYQVVAWSARALTSEELAPLGPQFAPGLYWLRWQSQAFSTTKELNDNLEMANVWSQTASAPIKSRETVLFPIEQWQIFFYRENAWSNALSSAGSSTLLNTNSSSASNSSTNLSSTNSNTNSSTSTSTSTGNSNSTTSANTTSQAPLSANLDQQLPSGIRLKIYLPNTTVLDHGSPDAANGVSGINDGSITLDWARPNFTPVRS